ncbi:glycoside hydrolase family 5 protein [Blastopirellula marina]|uniref:glycoside hydrolase family 5 protein n=1 Tax=Blastopirellula marina TaxID=124 RepID=UPI001F410021|nr:cellulase family glycosylhydrolase [Blastopirellula marina]
MNIAAMGMVSWGCSTNHDSQDSLLPFRTTLNLAGAEFGTNIQDFSQYNLGDLHRDYTFNSRATVRYFCERGVTAFRIPISWERLQPELRGPLQADYCGNLQLLLSWIAEAKGTAILDLHNYGRYRVYRSGRPIEAVLGETTDGALLLSEDDLADVWRKLAERLSDNPTVIAYGLMNEPHHIAAHVWKRASNRAVAAIRELDPDRWITVCGNEWATAQNFEEVNGPEPWIRDPSNKTIYEAHAYFDADRSGKYELTFDQEAARDPQLSQRPQQVLTPFLSWCRRNGVHGYVGEVGVPKSESRWHELLASGCRLIRDANCAIGYWAAGEWWGDYPLSVQPESLDDPLPIQMAVVCDNMRPSTAN